MKRRSVIASTGTLFSGLLGGCLQRSSVPGGSTENDSGDGIGDEERVLDCERRYIRNRVVPRDDETIDDELQPTAVERESRSEGEYVELRTEFGVTRETDDGPDTHVDYRVEARYLVTKDELYRSEESEDDPREGTVADC